MSVTLRTMTIACRGGRCSCHDRWLASNECIWCGLPAEPVQGVLLELLYPGRTTCTGCGRLQLHCSCGRPKAVA